MKQSDEKVLEIQQTLLTFKEDLLRHGKLAGKNADVWKQIQGALSFKISANALYTAAQKNRYNLRDILGMNGHPEICPQLSLARSDSSSDTDVSLLVPPSEFINDINNEDTSLEFDLKLDQAEFPFWQTSRVSYKNREYDIFTPGAWTHIIHKKFVERTSLKCTLMFKRAKVTSTGPIFAKINGSCSICRSQFLGKILSKPSDSDSGVIIHCTLNGKFAGDHGPIKKRPLSGTRRAEIAKQLNDNDVPPSLYRTQLAEKMMRYGDPEPAELPSVAVLQKAKYEKKREEQLHSNPILAIDRAKFTNDFSNIIRNVGYSPFFVHYWSSAQIHGYNSYCRRNYSRIFIDATGGVVKKIRLETHTSRNILLYEITIHDELNKKIYSVGSMLSESHNTLDISSWLSQWVRSGAAVPSEIVTDMSDALVYGCLLALSEFKSIQQYLEKCFENVVLSVASSPKVFLRYDVAHLSKAISGWDCFKGCHRLSRIFYLRVFGQIIQCDSIDDLKQLIYAMFVVAFSDTEGQNEVGEDTECEIKKKWLIQRVSTGRKDTPLSSALETEPIASLHERSEEVDEVADEEVAMPDNAKSFYTWAKNIIDEAKAISETSTNEGDRGNQQVLPQLEQPFLRLASRLPMWTAIMCRFYPKSRTVASSAVAEANFNDVKNILFKQKKLPIRADEFVQTHIKMISGKMKLALSTTMGTLEDTSNERGRWAITEVTPEGTCSFLSGINQDQLVEHVTIHNDQVAPTRTESADHHPDENQFIADETEMRRNMNVEEDWGGLVKKPSKRKRSSYLEPNSEMLHISLNNNITYKNMVITLLRNGHLDNLKPFQIGGKNIVLANTCGFDSIVQVAACAYCDSEMFKSFCFSLLECHEIFRLITGLVLKKGHREHYRSRANILHEIFPLIQQVESTYLLDTASCITTMLNKIWPVPSCQSVLRCVKNCIAGQTIDEFYVAVDLFNIDGIASALNSKLLDQNQLNCTSCHAELKRSVSLNPNFLFIEPTNLCEKSLQFDVTLNSIPKVIEIQTTYRLRGVVGFQGSPQTGELGHFVAFCLRQNYKWEEYNDLNQKVVPASDFRRINIQLLLYTP